MAKWAVHIDSRGWENIEVRFGGGCRRVTQISSEPFERLCRVLGLNGDSYCCR